MSGEKAYQTWLKQPVFLGQGNSAIVSRAQSFRIFMKEAILPFLTGNGYVLQNPDGVVQELASWIRCGLDRRLPSHRNHRYDRDVFDYRVNSEKWEEFWETWGSFADFAEHPDRQSELPEFLYARLDLEQSFASAEVNEMLAWEESEYQNQKEEFGLQNEPSYVNVKDKYSLY
jgi:hypothetical protein